MSSSLLIENGRVITLDDDDRSLRPGWIYVQDDQIEAIGEGDAPRSTTGSDITVDVGGDVVMPGMVNAHTHLFQTFARGTGDDVPLLEWVEKAILPITTHLTADDVRAATTVGLIENVRSGATSVLEHQYVRGDGGVDQAICQAALEVGSRMVLARGDLREDQDIRINGTHRSATVHEIEELVPVQKVDPRLLLRLPPLQRQLVGRRFRQPGQTVPQQLVGHGLHATVLPGRLLLQPAQEIIVHLQCRSRHTSRCIDDTSRCQ